MRFSTAALPVLAVLGRVYAQDDESGEAVKRAVSSTVTADDPPYSYSNMASARSSVQSVMEGNSPPAETQTVTVTGAAPSSWSQAAAQTSAVVKTSAKTTLKTSAKPAPTSQALGKQTATAKASSKTPATSAKTSSKTPSTTAKTSAKTSAHTSAKTSSSTKKVSSTTKALTPTKKLAIRGASTSASSSKAATSVAAAQASSSVSPQVALSSSVTVLSSTTSTSSAPIDVNTACAPQPLYASYLPSVNTYDGFVNDAGMYADAAAGTAPSGYKWNFVNLIGSVNNRGFLGVYQLDSYNVSACAAQCNNNPWCKAFNIFYERDPSFAPAPTCPDPVSQVSIRCTLWDGSIGYKLATNIGEWRASFAVRIAGSNGYTSTSVTNAINS